MVSGSRAAAVSAAEVPLTSTAAASPHVYRWRDRFFLYAPLVLPYLVYRRGYSILNSIGFLLYFGYAALLTINSRRLSREKYYLVFAGVMLGLQLLLRTRSGVNSSLGLIAFVIVYGEIIARVGTPRAIRAMAKLYVISIAYLALEIISQFGFLPPLVDSKVAAWSIIPPLQVGASLFMQSQASALVAIVGLAGAVAGFSEARTAGRKAIFVLGGLISLIVAVVDIRGTSLVSWVVAAMVLTIIKLGKKGVLTLVVGVSGAIALISANMEWIVQILGFRFIDPTTGFIDDRVVTEYLDVFLGLFHSWQQSPVADRLLGQRWHGALVGEFGFGTILYTEGLVILLVYLSFVLVEGWRVVRYSGRAGSRTAIMHFNLFAIILYLVSLTHYTNALNIGVGNLMALHIAINIALSRERVIQASRAAQRGTHLSVR